MSKINFDWKVGDPHFCKITNPKKDNYGNIVRVYRGGNGLFYSKDHDDWYEEDYDQDDFIVTDANNEGNTVKVNVDDDEYWNEFTAITAREIFIRRMNSETIYKSMAKLAVKAAKALTDELKKL